MKLSRSNVNNIIKNTCLLTTFTFLCNHMITYDVISMGIDVDVNRSDIFRHTLCQGCSQFYGLCEHLFLGLLVMDGPMTTD